MTNIERLIERLYESKPDKEEYDMKKIINPWKDMEGYNCFGCSPDNEAGVRMEFYEDGDEVVSIWKPRPEYQGWLNTLHGGIQSVLLDEICGWVVFRKLQTGGVTSKMETRFRKSISTNDTHVVLRASLREQKRNIAIIEARLYNSMGELCTEATCTYFTFPKEKAEAEFGDVMFSLINAARLYKINPDNALELTNQKFIRRFNYLEEHTIKQGKNLKDMTLEEMDAIWNEAKKEEK